MADWTLRRAAPGDAEAMAACLEAAYAEAAARIADLPPMAEDCAGEIARYQVWLAEVAGAVAGVLVLARKVGCLRLANVAVHPARRGLGLGRALMDLAESEARRQGFSELRLTTHAEMPENLRLYGRLGWRESGRSGNKVFMRKPL